MAEHPSKPHPMPAVGFQPRIGLALGGGVGRGWAHIGALRALLKHGIEPDLVAGTSIGALVGGAWLAGCLDSLEEWARGLSRLKLVGYLDFKVRSGGLIGGERLMRLMEEHFGDVMIEALPKPFIPVATDMASGHEVWMRRCRAVDAIRASFSLPGIFPPVQIEGRWLVDGAIVNPVPVAPLTARGAAMVIAINLNADVMGRVQPPGDPVPRAAGFDIFALDQDSGGVRAAMRNPLARRIFRRNANEPSLFGAMVSSFNIIMDRMSRSRLAAEPPDVTIAPRIGHVGPLEFDRAAELIIEGEAAVERALPDLEAALQVLRWRTDLARQNLSEDSDAS